MVHQRINIQSLFKQSTKRASPAEIDLPEMILAAGKRSLLGAARPDRHTPVAIAAVLRANSGFVEQASRCQQSRQLRNVGHSFNTTNARERPVHLAIIQDKACALLELLIKISVFQWPFRCSPRRLRDFLD